MLWMCNSTHVGSEGWEETAATGAMEFLEAQTIDRDKLEESPPNMMISSTLADSSGA